ncbi:MAG: glycosyltransferase family 2 protein [Aquabacterium sp.]|nr:glycosyltransferase family 2 protein [Aquabacterium sp.]
MRVTVITVTYNSLETLRETLTSVAAQTHTDLEHIVIDGGSTDGTLALLQAAGPRGPRWVSGRDAGIYDAMNKGLAMATGELIGFLNSDDIYADAEVVANLAACCETNAADAVYGDLIYVDPARARPLVRHWRSGEFRPARLGRGWMPPHPTFYARRPLMQAVGAFDATMRVAADYEFMLRCLTRPGLRVAYLPQVLVHMRVGGASNASLRALLCKTREDLRAIRRHGVGGWSTLLLKNLQKIPQFFQPRWAGSSDIQGLPK